MYEKAGNSCEYARTLLVRPESRRGASVTTVPVDDRTTATTKKQKRTLANARTPSKPTHSRKDIWWSPPILTCGFRLLSP
jgi:hypothetical protein